VGRLTEAFFGVGGVWGEEGSTSKGNLVTAKGESSGWHNPANPGSDLGGEQ